MIKKLSLRTDTTNWNTLKKKVQTSVSFCNNNNNNNIFINDYEKGDNLKTRERERERESIQGTDRLFFKVQT